MLAVARWLRSVGSLGFGDSGDETRKTDFAAISGSFTIVDGILENRDFKMLAPLVRVTGEGRVPLPPQTVDYTAEAKLVASARARAVSTRSPACRYR